MCAYSPKSQLHPGLRANKSGQQLNVGDSPPLLRSHETPPGVPRPAPGSSVQERHGPVGAGPKEGHRNNPGAGTPPLMEES